MNELKEQAQSIVNRTGLLLLLLLMLPATVQAQFNYTTANGTITITGYTGPGGAVTIPNRIPDTTNGLPVTSIGGWAFYEWYGLTSVTIPDSVSNIGEDAFAYCWRLTNVTIGTNVTSIEDGAFSGCTSLNGVTIPDSVISIGSGAFGGCSSLTSVIIPDSVTNIGNSAFSFCTSLTAITVDALNSAYIIVDGVLFDKSQTTLIQYPVGQTGASYTIPSGVISIGSGAFGGCSSLTSVIIPDSVTSIGSSAFYECSSLTGVNIPDSVTSIGDYAFYSCSSLTNVTIGENVTDIGDWAFFQCTSLTSIAIPNSVTNIGDVAFDECFSLTTLTIGSGVTSIGDWAFGDCYKLTGVTIPNSVTNIGDEAFDDCTSLTGITVEAINPAYISVDGVLFNKSQTTLIQFPIGQTGTSYTIPNSVTNIGALAFSGCTSLTGVTIGTIVTSIGVGAFWFCPSLTIVYFQGNAPSFAYGAPPTWGSPIPPFFNNPTTIYYLPGTTGWDDVSTNTGLPTVLWTPQVQTSDASFGVRTNQFGFTINWASGMTVVVEACTSLANPVWYPLATNTLTSGSAYFSDPQWTNYPARFYRLRSP